MKHLITLAMIIAASFAPALAQCSDADKKALEAWDHAWTQANTDGNRARLMEIYADEFAAFPGMTGKSAAIENAMAAFERNKVTPPTDRTTADHYMIACTPMTATVTHRNVTFRPNANGGKGETVYGRSVHFLEKRSGKWVAVSNAGGPLSDSDILRYMEMDWVDAMKSRNVDWLEKNYAPDFTELSFMTGQVMSRQQAIDGIRNDKSTFDVLEISEVSVRVDGNAGIVTGKGHAKGRDGSGKPFDMTLRFTDMFVKRDGRWLAWASSATPTPQA